MHPSTSGLRPTQQKGHQRHPARTPTTRLPQSISHHPAAPSARATLHPPCTPPTAEKHHGNHARSKPRKAQRTANPKLRTNINPEVQSSRDSVRHEHKDTRYPHHRQDRTAGKEQPPHHNEQRRRATRKKAHQQHGSNKLRTKRPKQPPRPTRAIIGHTGQIS